MTDIALLVSDPALREALSEQLSAAKLGAPRVLENVKNETADVWIIDEALTNPQTIAAIESASGHTKPVILMLGGADDVPGVQESFAKPFRLGHLLARLRYYLETAPLLRESVIRFGSYRLEPQNRRLLSGKDGEIIRLTEKETALLVFLAHQTKPATRRDILAGVWGYDEKIDTHTLETHIYQLRRKLDRSGENWLINEASAYHLRGEE